MFSFNVTHTDSSTGARTAELVTPHGVLETPNFIFCATKAAIKGLSMEAMKRAGTGIILSNTYHLMVQPGADTVEKLGGLHRMTTWDKPMLTDSGGYQIFSMAGAGAEELQGRGRTQRPNTVLKIEEEGVRFRSYLDGQEIRLTPESSMHIQGQLGADLIMAFDECTALAHSRDYTANSMERTHRWAKRCIAELERIENARAVVPGAAATGTERTAQQAMYGIIQGGIYRDLREQAADFITQQNFFGTAFGGCYGKTKNDLYEMLGWVSAYLKKPRPVHLLGIGDIGDIFKGVRAGIDTFDCVQPTRLGRHGFALMPQEENGRINLRNARFAGDPSPLDPENHHPHTAHYTRGYIHHLIKAEELLGIQILVEHNVAVMNRLMRDVRAGIKAGTLNDVEKRWTANVVTEEMAA
jgi:queuine tRNA-ribosyltransferase